MTEHSIDDVAGLVVSTRTDLHDLIADLETRLDGIRERLDRIETLIGQK